MSKEKYVTKDGKFDYHKWTRLNSGGDAAVNEHTVTFTADDMKTLHGDGEVTKTDPDGKDHTYMYQESRGINEAPMDNRFAKEWDSNVTALLNHLNHEYKKGKGVIGQTNLGMIKKMIDAVKEVKSIPSLLGKIIGTN